MKLYRPIIELTYWDIEDSKATPIVEVYKSSSLVKNIKGDGHKKSLVSGFINKCVLNMSIRHSIDPDNIFVTGISYKEFNYSPCKEMINDIKYKIRQFVTKIIIGVLTIFDNK